MTGQVLQESRTCLLGGETEKRSLLGAGVTRGRLAVVIPLTAVGLLVLVAVRSLAVLVVEVLVGAGVWMLQSRRDVHGQAATDSLLDGVRWWVEQRNGTATFTPTDGGDETSRVGRVRGSAGRVPPELGQFSVLTYAPPSKPEARLALLEHGVAPDGYFSATLEVAGSGDGLREIREVNAQGRAFGGFLYALSRPEFPVDQIDVATRVVPVFAADYRRWLGQRLRPDAPAGLQDSMWELAEQASWSGERYRTYLTVRMPRAALATAARHAVGRDRITREDLKASAFEAVGEVMREANAAGLTVRSGLGPRRLGGLIRHTWCPTIEPDNDHDITDLVDGFPGYSNHRSHVALDAASLRGRSFSATSAPDWCHAVASVPRDAWPINPVGVRWLEALVTDVSPPMVRTVNAQFRLIPKAKARQLAFAAHTVDVANEASRDRAGRISTGVEEAQTSASGRLLADLISGAAGCRPALRVLVSARTRQELAFNRERLTSAAVDAGLGRLRWHDTRHHHAMLLALPLARGIR